MDRNLKIGLVLVVIGVVACSGLACFVIANTGEKPHENPYVEVTGCYSVLGNTTKLTMDCYNFSDPHKEYEIVVLYRASDGSWQDGGTEIFEKTEQGREIFHYVKGLDGRTLPLNCFKVFVNEFDMPTR